MTDAWIAPGSHAVQFHIGERLAHHAVAEFFSHDAGSEDCLVLMSRYSTFRAVEQLLASGRYGQGAPIASRLKFVDADLALPRIMSGESLNPEQARRFFAELLDRNGPVSGNGLIRLYGELVDILCERGHVAAAVEMEDIAPALFEIEPRLSILCGYGIERFRDHAGPARLRAICERHAHVIPPGGLPDDPAPRRTVPRRVRPVGRSSSAGTVYVVDDDASMRRSLARLLACTDWPARTFASAEAFLEEAPGLPDGCLVVDIQLLGINGLDLIGQLVGIRPHWPIIAMSGSHDEEIEFEALRLGARVFLRKPFEPQRLLDEVASALP